MQRIWANRNVVNLVLAWLVSANVVAQPAATERGLLDKLLRRYPELFGNVVNNPAQYDVQIIYTQINRDAQNRPTFRTYRYGADKARYFYPASTVKLPAVLLALEELRARGIDKYTTMLTDSAAPEQTTVRRDTSARRGRPSVAHYAKKILLVSDNDAYNRLYELLGSCAINERLYAKGYRNLRIVHRLESPLTPAQNQHTNPVRFVDSTGRVLWAQPAQVCTRPPVAPAPILRGKGFMRRDSLIRQPFDFTQKNYFALEEQQDMLRAVLFPDDVPARQRFNLGPDDYRFLYQYLSQVPAESMSPRYDSTYYDSYCKFLLAGDTKLPLPKTIRIFNKVGDAYGYLIDNAYVVDFERGIEFMLSAVIYCNADGIFNDNRYEYEHIGLPFLSNLGRVIFDYEVRRKRPFRPNLSRFRVAYDR